MSSFAGLNTAMTGLHAYQRTIEVIGHNVANVQTEGFSRRQVVLEPAVGLRVSSRFDNELSWSNLGVNIATINRVRDVFLDAKARTAGASAAESSRVQEVLNSIETIFPEPSDNAINDKLASFWNAFAESANQPDSNPQRTSILAQAETLISSINQAASSLQGSYDNFQSQLDAVIAEANSLSEQVGALNAQIRQSAISGMNAADMMDQRDMLIDRLSALTGATARPGENSQMDVILGGSALVSGSLVEKLSVQNTGALPPPLDGLDVQQVQVRWARDGYPAASLGGEAGGLAKGLNDVIPRYMHDLDVLTEQLVTTVNTAHAAGEGQAGETGLNFFAYAGAGPASKTITLSSDVAGQPSKIALASIGAGPLDGSNGYAMAALATAASGPNSQYQTMLGRLGVETQAAANRASTQQQFSSEAQAQRSSVNGVNLDEEMTNLVMAQRAYEASARLLTAVDELLDILINRTGVVGR